jgi:aldose sugar dehydrogenase
MKFILSLPALMFLAAACQAQPANTGRDAPFKTEVIADYDEPWAMAFLPDGKSYLVTDKRGKLLLTSPSAGKSIEVRGVPKVDYGGQGGMGDVVLSPHFAKNKEIYLSWIEAGEKGTRGAVVGKAKLGDIGSGLWIPVLEKLEIIWRQSPKVTGRGHYSHRIAFSPDGKYIFIGSGERQKFDPAQDMTTNLGKIVRLNLDGSSPSDNPFAQDAWKTLRMHEPPRDDLQRALILQQIWSLGHRNILGLAFDDKGQLWNQEMGPQGGDELNLVKVKANYGYPKVSNGDHYDGRDIPDHKPGDGFEAPKVFWNPVISPSGLLHYTGNLFPEWKGSMFIGGLSSESLVRVKLDGDTATKADQFPMGARIREVEQGPDGAIWILEDGDGGSQGRLLRLTPKN